MYLYDSTEWSHQLQIHGDNLHICIFLRPATRIIQPTSNYQMKLTRSRIVMVAE